MSTINSAIKSVFYIDPNVGTTDRLVLIYIRSILAEHGAAFPSYAMIAQACGIVRRTAMNAVQRLVDGGHLDKDHRYNPDVPADRPKAERQLSNSYTIPAAATSSNSPSTDTTADSDVSSNSPVFKPLKDLNYLDYYFNNKTEEEDNIHTRTRESSSYPQESPAETDETGGHVKTREKAVQETAQQAFESEVVRRNVPSALRAAILDYVRAFGGMRQFSAEAIRRAFRRAYDRMRYGTGLSNPPKWIATAIRNEHFNVSMAG